MGHFTPLVEATDHLRAKLLRLATAIGKDSLKAFVTAQIKTIQLSP